MVVVNRGSWPGQSCFGEGFFGVLNWPGELWRMQAATTVESKQHHDITKLDGLGYSIGLD